MKTIDLIYLFIVVVMASPYLQIRAAQWRRRRALRRYSHACGATAVGVVHRQETVAVMGVPLFRFVTVTLVDEALAALRRVADDEAVDIVVHLPAGVDFDGAPLATALAARRGPTRLTVPCCALSGCLALARQADNVVLGPEAVIGDGTGAALAAPGLRASGIEAQTDIDDSIWAFLALCPQPPRRRPSPLYLTLARPRRPD